MKKILVFVIAAFAAATLVARPGPGFGPRPGFGRMPPPPPMHHHHHHHHSSGGAIAAGIVGGAILGGIVSAAVTPRTTTVVTTPAPVVVQPAPVVVQPAPVVVAPQPVYQTQNVWVEGRYVDTVQPNGAVLRTWQPGHYEQRTVQIQ